MANQRAPDLKMIGCWVDPDFMSKIDSARRGTPRSQFFRDAIADKLKSVGIPVEPEEAQAPDRAGKGGRPRLSSEEKEVRAIARREGERMLAAEERSGRKGAAAKRSADSASPGRGAGKRSGGVASSATGTSGRGGSPSAVERTSKVRE